MKAILGAMLVFSISAQVVIADEIKEKQIILMSTEILSEQGATYVMSSPIYENDIFR